MIGKITSRLMKWISKDIPETVEPTVKNYQCIELGMYDTPLKAKVMAQGRWKHSPTSIGLRVAIGSYKSGNSLGYYQFVGLKNGNISLGVCRNEFDVEP